MGCLNRLKTFVHGLKKIKNSNETNEVDCGGELSGIHCLAFDCQNCPYVEEKFWEALNSGEEDA